ncbi:hypothetical protein EAI_17482 [Harpegnathos saltator]|uniref:Uncharacterized protein n=1 Tax=Harpegnathos saltator TaxID=610380 RepID=E2C3N1_HARSA|nr:hypothetical protein EAI_17482 [Harpegnathos saltator]
MHAVTFDELRWAPRTPTTITVDFCSRNFLEHCGVVRRLKTNQLPGNVVNGASSATSVCGNSSANGLTDCLLFKYIIQKLQQAFIVFTDNLKWFWFNKWLFRAELLSQRHTVLVFVLNCLLDENTAF